MDLVFKKCTLNDLDVLTEISRTTFIQAFEKDNEPEDFKDYVGKAFHPGQLKKELLKPATHFYFVYNDQTLVGYFKINEAGGQSDLNKPNTLELERIYVKSSFQGKNLGMKMLEKVIEIASSKKIEHIWLGVWEHNKGAIRFYERRGFIKFGEHPYWIGTDEQTDYLMKLAL